MGKLKSGTTINSTYNAIINGPFDNRQTVATYNDLGNNNTWLLKDSEQDYYPVYQGMLVTVQDTGKIYILKELTQTDINTAPSNMVWAEAVGSGSGSEGPVGPTGPSAYDVWKSLGNTGSQQEFIASLKGEKGDSGQRGATGSNGVNGKSAYDIWLEDPANTGKSKEDFLVSLKGEKGDTGSTGATGATGATGSDGQAATILVGTVTTVDSNTQASVTNSGTESAAVFNFSIPKGPKGDKGADGTGVSIKADADSCAILGDSYIDQSTGHLMILTSIDPKSFTDGGEIKGPQGPKGDTGATGVSIVGITGPTGAAGQTVQYTVNLSNGESGGTFNVYNGKDGKKGDPGQDGKAATIIVGDVTTGDTGTEASVVNTGSESAAVLNFTIPRGEKGEQGDVGPTGATGSFSSSDWSVESITGTVDEGVNSLAHAATLTSTPVIDTYNKKLGVSINLQNVIGRGINKLLLQDPETTEPSGCNKYKLQYTSKDNNNEYEESDETINVYNGRGIASIAVGNSSIDVSNNDYSQLVIAYTKNNIEVGDPKTNTVNIPLPKFELANRDEVLSVNGKDVKLTLTQKEQAYTYTIGTTGDAKVYAPIAAGESGQILKSSGSGAPTWVERGDSSVQATTSTYGFVKVGDNLDVVSGKISVPTATASTLGVVKVTSSNGLNLSNGTISKAADSFTITAKDKNGFKYSYKLNGASSDTTGEIDINIDDGELS